MDAGRGRGGVLALAALAPVSVLVVDPGGWFPFGPLRWAAVSVLVPLAAALALRRGPLRLLVAPTLAAAGLAAWMAVAALAGLDPLYAWTGTPERHFGVATWVLLAIALVAGQAVDTRRDGSLVAGGLVVAGIGVGAVATAEALGWEPAVLDVGTRLSSTLGSSAYLGAAVALLAPVAVGVAADRDLARPLRTGAGLAAGLLAVAGVGAGARAAWVGLLAAAVVLAVARRDVLARRPRRTLAGAAALLATLAIVAVVTPAGPRAAAVFDPDAPGGAGRLDEWRVAAQVVTDHLVTGTGPEGYRIAAAGAIDDAYERANGRDPLPDRAHAAPLDIAAAGGLPALALWLAVVALVGRAAVRSLRGPSRWRAGVAVALVAHLGGQLLLFPVVELEPVAWFLGGLLLSATARPGEAREVIVARAVPAALGVVAVVALVAGVVDVRADRHARTAADALAAGDPAAAVLAARSAVAARPDVVRLHLLEARAVVEADQGTLAGDRGRPDRVRLDGRRPRCQRPCVRRGDHPRCRVRPGHRPRSAGRPREPRPRRLCPRALPLH